MSKKTAKTKRPLSPRPRVRQEDTAHLVREELNEQQESLKQAAQAEVPGSAVPTTPAPESVNLVTALATLWPNSVPPPREGPAPAQVPEKTIEAAPVAATVPLAAAPGPRIHTEPSKASSPALQKVEISFVLFEPNAKQVSLSGDFTKWACDAIPLKRRADGHWETTLALAPGRHEYKFIVDGQWLPDPAAKEHVWNRHGSLNSVIEIRAELSATSTGSPSS